MRIPHKPKGSATVERDFAGLLKAHGADRRVRPTLVKTIVINEKDQTRVPFLRGILIRSLLDAGLEFDHAYRLATDVRDELADTAEISSDDIRQRMCHMLEDEGHLGALEPYRLPLAAPGRIVVNSPSRGASAF